MADQDPQELVDDTQEVVEDPEETDEERQDPEVAARRAAAMAFIRRYGDPVLKSRATQVDRFDDALRDQVGRMGAIMDDAIGVGLAAPQVGLSQRLLVYRVGHDSPLIAVINPEVEWSSDDEESLEEGCLSLPGVHVDVDRAIHVRVRAQDEHGDARLIEASGLEARVLQHEIDHLNGVLILDHASRDQRKEAFRALREQERERAEQAA
ncbi:MAG: peptide deformylase [Thermoleophilaceae bacterium]|jgi:peptide deformylase|nr:peptide deformylase [Thermoleophilaceae bacterium]